MNSAFKPSWDFYCWALSLLISQVQNTTLLANHSLKYLIKYVNTGILIRRISHSFSIVLRTLCKLCPVPGPCCLLCTDLELDWNMLFFSHGPHFFNNWSHNAGEKKGAIISCHNTESEHGWGFTVAGEIWLLQFSPNLRSAVQERDSWKSSALHRKTRLQS